MKKRSLSSRFWVGYERFEGLKNRILESFRVTVRLQRLRESWRGPRGPPRDAAAGARRLESRGSAGLAHFLCLILIFIVTFYFPCS